MLWLTATGLLAGLVTGCAPGELADDSTNPASPVRADEPTAWTLRVQPLMGWKRRPERDWLEVRFFLKAGPWCQPWARAGTHRGGRGGFPADPEGLSFQGGRLRGELVVHRPNSIPRRIHLDLPVQSCKLAGPVRVSYTDKDGKDISMHANAEGSVRNATELELSGLGGPGWPEWIQQLPWTRVVDVTEMPGDTWDDRIAAAQDKLGPDGGVVYIPAGTYELARTIRLRAGVVLRGANPSRVPDARSDEYELPTRLIFPRFAFSAEGGGTPRDSAFRGIELARPSASDVGVVNLDIDNGHIHLGEQDGFADRFNAGQAGTRWLVYGCILRNAATLDPEVPADFQHRWQRWSHRHAAAIWLFTGGDVLVANNRIPRSGQADFVMEGFRVYKDKPATHEQPKTKEVTEITVPFDYDNRPGICVNGDPLAKGLQIWDEADAVTDPPTADGPGIPPKWGLARGIDIRHNYVYCTGSAAIKTSGDGAYVGYNIIRYAADVVRPTYTGLTLSNFTNNNRAIELRGWRWTVEGNDYEVYSNYGPDGTKYVDGEGIMHEAWENVGVRGGRILNNRGNAYICLWRVPVRGLEIRGNQIRTPGGQAAITVLSITNKNVPLPCEGVKIVDNITEVTGIRIVGRPGEGNEIRGNRHVYLGRPGTVSNFAGADVADNTGYECESGQAENWQKKR